MQSQHTIPAGTILFHGTSADDDFDELEGPAWVTDSRQVAERFMRYSYGSNPRVLTFRAAHNITLPRLRTPGDLADFMDRVAPGVDYASAREMAEAVYDAGEDGWFIPNNYPDGGADILLCDPSDLELLPTGRARREPAFLRREFPAPSERQRRLAAAAARVQVDGPVRRVQLARGVVGHFATPPMAERARRDRQTGERVRQALKQIPRGRRRLVTHRSPLHEPMKGIDVFSGIGGLGRGAELAGARVVWAANHWCEAVTYHAANMPHAEHVCRDVGEIRDWGIVPPHDLGMYGPSCKGFTRALGKREGAQYDAYRATMWTVLEAVEYHLPPYILVENVPEVRNWNLYPVWLKALEVMGYKLTENILNAADAGAAINRTRLFVVGVRQGPALQLPKPTVGPRPFDDVVDWNAGDWRPVEPDERIAAGLKPLKRKWLEVTRRTAQTLRAKRFVIPYFGATRVGFGVDRPLGSITTKQRYYLVDMTKSPGGMRRGVLPREKALAMGFPGNTILPTSATDANIMLGNAVSPWIARYCVSHIEDHRQRFGG